MPPEELLN